MVDANYQYQDYDADTNSDHRPAYLKPMLCFLSELPKDSKILDAGCGAGNFSVSLHEAGFRIFGCDMSATGVAHANARNIGTFVENSLYDSLTAPFETDSFDAIVSVEVIEHLYSPRLFCQRAIEALRPGGLLIITTPYWGYAKNVALALTDRIDGALTVLWDGGHIKHFSKKTLTAMMVGEGFEVVGFRGCGTGLRAYTPFLWNGMIMAFRKPL